MHTEFKHNFFQLLIAIDQLLNVLVCMFINPFEKHWADETFSSHTYRHYRDDHWKLMYKVVNTLFFWQPEHCKQAYQSEIERAHEPPELRK